MNLEKVKFDICRSFRKGKQYFILGAPGIKGLVIPEVRILELPIELRRKFYMQQGISFRILMPALNQWIKENNGDRKSDGSRADSEASKKGIPEDTQISR